MTARRSLGARSGFSSFAFYGVLLTLAVGGPVACADQAYAAGPTPLQATGRLRFLLLAQRGLLAALPQAATVITYRLI